VIQWVARKGRKVSSHLHRAEGAKAQREFTFASRRGRGDAENIRHKDTKTQ